MYRWKGFVAEEDWLFKLLKEYLNEDVILSDSPNMIIYSVFCGKYRKKLIKDPSFQIPIKKKPNIKYKFITGENEYPQKLAYVNLTFKKIKFTSS